MSIYTKQRLEAIRWKTCDRLNLWKFGDWAAANIPGRLGRAIWAATLPF